VIIRSSMLHALSSVDMILLNFMISDTGLFERWRQLFDSANWYSSFYLFRVLLPTSVASSNPPGFIAHVEFLEENSLFWRISGSYNAFFRESWYCIPVRPFANLCRPVASWPDYYSIELRHLTDTAQRMPDGIATYSLLPWEWRQHVPRTCK
jgi:hypothetical protein